MECNSPNFDAFTSTSTQVSSSPHSVSHVPLIEATKSGKMIDIKMSTNNLQMTMC